MVAGKFHHEALYRGSEKVEHLATVNVTLCGAGALGSNLADNLIRQGFRQLRVVDRDRVEQHNVNTQIYGEGDVGAWKADVLRNHVFRVVGVEIETIIKEFSERTAGKFLKGSDVVIDTFDNSRSRQSVQMECRKQQLDCLHVGLFTDYCESIWDDNYRIPQDVDGDVCDYPLARNLVLLAVAVASESLVRFVLEGEQADWSATLRDFAVRSLESSFTEFH